MASFSTASLFLVLTNSQPPSTRARTTTISTITPVFIGSFSFIQDVVIQDAFVQEVDGVNHLADLLQICGQQRHGFDILRLDLFFAPIEKAGEWRRIDSEAFTRMFDNVPFPRRGVNSTQNQRMTEQHAKCRDRVCQQTPQNILIRKYARGLLAQTQQFGAQILLHLGAVKFSIDLKRRNNVGAVQNAMMLPDVVKF